MPDCANITQTLAQHAQMLLAAGIDYVALDATNLQDWPSDQSDLVQLRPTEVLFEEWAALRRANISTPRIVVWNKAATGAVLWQQYLQRLYNNPTCADLLVTNPRTGRRLFFVPNNPGSPANESIIAAIQANGGANDVEVIKVWADLDPQGRFTIKEGR